MRLTAGANYRSAGTVEFLYDAARDDFFFLEVNTRLQVEHGVTEQVTGVDLVEWMIRGAAGDFTFLDGFVAKPKGHSIQVRLYAEDPSRDFQPSSGRLVEVAFPPEDRTTLRVDGWVESGSEVPAWYDPMLAKLIVTAPTRDAAIVAMAAALDATRLAGIETNLRWLRAVVRSPVFVSGNVSTRALGEFDWQPSSIPRADRGRGDHGAGLSRAGRFVGCRGAAIGTDGRTVVPAGQIACSAMPKTPLGSKSRRRGRRCNSWARRGSV